MTSGAGLTISTLHVIFPCTQILQIFRSKVAHWGKFTALSVCVLSCFSCVPLFVTPWTVAHQVPLSMGFSRQEYWSGLPFPSPGDLSDPWIESMSLMSLALAGRFFTTHASFLCRENRVLTYYIFSCVSPLLSQKRLDPDTSGHQMYMSSITTSIFLQCQLGVLQLSSILTLSGDGVRFPTRFLPTFLQMPITSSRLPGWAFQVARW